MLPIHPAAHALVAIRYYSEYPIEVDAFIEMVEAEGAQLERALASERALIG